MKREVAVLFSRILVFSKKKPIEVWNGQGTTIISLGENSVGRDPPSPEERLFCEAAKGGPMGTASRKEDFSSIKGRTFFLAKLWEV